MPFNMYSQIPKIKQHLAENGKIENITMDDLARSMMLVLGLKPNTVRKWINYFEEIGLITITGDKVIFR